MSGRARSRRTTSSTGADAARRRTGTACVRLRPSKRGTGSFDFKKNWGFEAQPLHYEYCLLRRDGIPQNNPANPKYRAFIEVWRPGCRGRWPMPSGLRSCATLDNPNPMEPLLYLVHRMPFRPQGDKIRSYHLLRQSG